MPDHLSSTPESGAPIEGWSTRLLILALIGILFLTLFPFRLTAHAKLSPISSPFLLGGWGKNAGGLNVYLNVLLFMPFGFALGEKLREKGKSWVGTLIVALASGALLSYAIEFVQLYIPMRDSGWEDVVTNASGSVAGFVLFELCGAPLVRLLSVGESTLGKLVKWPRTALTLSVYFGLWLAISVPLQMQTRLSDWNSDSLLVVGNDSPGHLSTAWKGQLFRLQLWDRPIQAEVARQLATGATPDEVPAAPLADYDFTKPAETAGLRDRRNLLPPLSLINGPINAPPMAGDPPYLTLDGRSWLISKEPVFNLVSYLKKTNQFAIRLVCKPLETWGSDGRLIGIWERSGPLELRIRQENADLIVYLRNPISASRSDLVWRIPGVFQPDQTRDILLSYDGSNASLYLDGKPAARTYRLGPGAVLAHHLRMVRTGELNGYIYIYYFLIFFPGGILIGISANSVPRRNRAALFLGALTFFLLPAFLLEYVLVSVSGRAVSPAYLLLSVLLSVVGSLWIRADRPPSARTISL
jgi:glycopeptide antibiotics resistance protein